MSQNDPTKATPQAPRSLRVGSRGYARALAAAADKKPPPDEEPDDDEDEPEDSAKPAAPGEPDTEGMAAASEACKTASEACARAGEQLDATAAELDGGTDSISTLQATEAACDEAVEELQEAKAKCMALRGAEAEEPAPAVEAPPPAAQARALAGASPVRTAEAHVETARLAAFGAYALQRLGLTAADTVKAKGVLGTKLDLANEAVTAKKAEAATRATSETARREKIWEDGVRSRRVQMAQAFARVDGPDGTPVREYSVWAKAQNAAYPELAAFESWMSSRVPEPGTREAEPSTLLADLANEKHDAFALDERGKLEARRAGVDPAQLAAQLGQQQQRGAMGAGERA